MRPIKGYEGLYSITRTGKVWSYARQGSKTNFLKPGTHGKGYLFVRLSKNNVAPIYDIHRLVALTYIPNPQNKPQVNHKNGIKVDNRVSNLEWCTASENILHAFKIGLKVPIRKQVII